MDSFQTGLIASTIANSVRDPKKKKKPFTPQDFMAETDKPETTPEQQRANLDAVMAAWGGKKVTGPPPDWYKPREA